MFFREERRIENGKYDNHLIDKELFTFSIIMGIVCHAYGLLNLTISHDSLDSLYADVSEFNWKMELGRWATAFYRQYISGAVSTPWFRGGLGLIYLSIAVCIIVKLLNVKEKLGKHIIAGIMVTNYSVIVLIASYIHDFDCDMLALLLAVVSTYLWDRYRLGWIGAIFPLAISMGFYQSFIAVMIVLILIIFIEEILDQEYNLKDIFVRGIKAAFTIILGGGAVLFYYYYYK